MNLSHNTILMEKLAEALKSVMPVAIILFLLCFSIVPVPNSILMSFVVGTILLIVGMGLFTLGTDLAMTPIGEYIGSAVSRSRSMWIIVAISLVVGVMITISEPDLHVLAQQVPNIPNAVIIGAVSAGVGVFLVLSMLRIFLRIPLQYLLIGFYLLVFMLARFVPREYLSTAFDSGGVTTGPMTVPFIMALGVGVAMSRSDESAQEDSFGLVALCSIGPILAVLLLGMFYRTGGGAYTPVSVPDIENSRELWRLFATAFPSYFKEVAIALLPIALFFLLFHFVKLRIPKTELVRIGFGMLYTYLGLVIFLTGANVGFMPLGNYVGQRIGGLTQNWIIIPIGMIIGYFIVSAEPAVHVLNKQVEEMTSGAIPHKAMGLSLSIGVAVSVGLAMMRVLTGLPILYLLIPGYALSLLLSFFVPPIFTSIAFDSGGVASGPMTATFLLPLAMGLCTAVGGNVAVDAFGVVAMVAMTPLITIQVMGLVFKLRSQKAVQPHKDTEQKDQIITFEEDTE
ncbi:MAG: DUF1538 domain-containing protein [Eubacteriales bacterium]|nr:DUF1538 domain-containing protein [Eubacteriales bacterium]